MDKDQKESYKSLIIQCVYS